MHNPGVKDTADMVKVKITSSGGIFLAALNQTIATKVYALDFIMSYLWVWWMTVAEEQNINLRNSTFMEIDVPADGQPDLERGESGFYNNLSDENH